MPRHRRHHDDYSSSSDRDSDYKTVRRYIIRETDRDSDYRPRSADHLESSVRIVERPRSYVEYDRELSYERDEPERRTRTIVYERDEPRSSRAWDWDREDEVRIERRREAPRYELVTRETEYYERPEPARQLVIREKTPVIVEAPQSTVEVRRHETVEMPRPESRREEETYYRRHEIRDTASPEDNYFSERRVARHRGSGSSAEWSTDENVVVRRTPRGRSRSHSPHHKLHLAEGAAAGAAAGAIIADHRSKSGVRHPHKAAQVASGAVLGAVGAELATRAHRHYSHNSHSRGRSSSSELVAHAHSRHGRSRRSSSSPEHEHSKLKMGLGAALVGATALAAGKYFKDRRDDRRAEEGRGRSRTRSRSRPGSASADHEHRHLDPKHRSNTIAKAGAVGAAAMGIAEAVQARSRSRKGERSKSRLRTGAEIVGAGLASAAAAGIYENRQAKKEAKDERGRARSVSRPRSGGYEEEGLVEYGASPLHGGRSASGYADDPLMINAPPHGDGVFMTGANRWRSRSRSRSKSRVREAIGAAAATAAAAVGVHKYRDRKRRKEAEAAQRERGMRRYSSHESDTSDGYSDYSTSPPRASGGAYYPQTNTFPPPPVPHHPHTDYPPSQPSPQQQTNPNYYPTSQPSPQQQTNPNYYPPAPPQPPQEANPTYYPPQPQPQQQQQQPNPNYYATGPAPSQAPRDGENVSIPHGAQSLRGDTRSRDGDDDGEKEEDRLTTGDALHPALRNLPPPSPHHHHHHHHHQRSPSAPPRAPSPGPTNKSVTFAPLPRERRNSDPGADHRHRRQGSPEEWVEQEGKVSRMVEGKGEDDGEIMRLIVRGVEEVLKEDGKGKGRKGGWRELLRGVLEGVEREWGEGEGKRK